MLRFVGEQFATADVFARCRTGLRLGCRNCFLPAAIERCQHGDRSDDRFALHDVARSRDAAAISPTQPARRSHVAVSHCRWPAHRCAALCGNFTALAGLYAIGVVGAITVNLGSCTFNRTYISPGTIACSLASRL